MAQKVLFIDRDGTMIKETIDEQIDGFDKMIFYPKCIPYLSKIAMECRLSFCGFQSDLSFETAYERGD